MKPATGALIIGLLACVLSLPLAAQEGCWVGAFGSSRGAFSLAPVAGGWQGAVHRLGTAVDSDSLTMVQIDGGSVRLTFPAALGPEPASFAGQIDGTTLTGTIRSQGNDIPVTLTLTDPVGADPAGNLIGFWNGGLEQSGATVVRLMVEVAAAPCGQVVASLSSPDQTSERYAVADIRVVGDSVQFGVPTIGGSFRGTIEETSRTLSGTWTQGAASLAMRLERGDSAFRYARPQEPQPPFPYESVEVTYRNEADDVVLAGTLTIPGGAGPFPAVLMLTGSGAQDRDESLMGHRPFFVIADYLTRRGVAVLRVDDRGVGGSSGSTFAATIPDNVQDAAAGIEFLEGHPAVDDERIGVIGHSEGGWVAPALAAQSDVAFLALLAGPAVPPEDILIAQNRALMEAAGQPGVDQQVALTAEMIRIVRDEPDDERAIAAMLDAMEAALQGFPPEAPIRAQWEMPAYQAQLRQNLGLQVSPWFRGLLDFDPTPYLEDLEIPVLALYGARDLQVPATQSVDVLERLWADHPDATVHTFPELNHLFQHARTGLPAEYAQIEESFAPEALEMLGDWITQRFLR